MISSFSATSLRVLSICIHPHPLSSWCYLQTVLPVESKKSNRFIVFQLPLPSKAVMALTSRFSSNVSVSAFCLYPPEISKMGDDYPLERWHCTDVMPIYPASANSIDLSETPGDIRSKSVLSGHSKSTSVVASTFLPHAGSLFKENLLLN